MPSGKPQLKVPAKRSPMTLRNLREARHVTQEEIAKKCHSKQEFIEKLEKRDNPRFSALVKMVKAMGGKVTVKVSFRDGMKEQLIFSGNTSAKKAVKRQK